MIRIKRFALAFGFLVLLTLSMAPGFQVHQHGTSGHAPVYPDSVTAASSGSTPVTGSDSLVHLFSGNATATSQNISYGPNFVGSNTKVWATQYINLSTWNGTINARIGAGLYFIPGFYNGARAYMSTGTVWANITYGNETACWTHVFNSYEAEPGDTGVYNFTTIAPEWNISVPFSGEVIFNLTVTCDPGHGWSGSPSKPWNFPQGLHSYLPPNGTDGTNSVSFYNNSVYNPPPPGSPIPFSWGYLELSYATPTASTNTEINASMPGIASGNASYSLAWIFNDGSRASGYSANHTYSTAGVHDLRVNVTNVTGAVEMHYFNVTVDLYVSISDSTVSGIAPLQESFDSSVLGGSSYSYSWNFGNGATSVSSSPSENFGMGNFTVNLEVTDQSGDKGYASIIVVSLPEPVSLSYSPMTNVTVLTSVNFEARPAWYASNSSILWTLSNRNQYLSMSFNYTFPVYSASNSVFVQFQYYDNGSRSYNTSMDVKMVPSIPVLQVSGIKSTILVNTTLTLNASSSFSYDAAIQDYQWTYNNVTYGNPVQSFFFSSTGTSNVTLKITDSLGAIASETFHISIVKPSESSSINISVNVTGGSQFVNFRINVTSNQAIQSVEAVISGPSSSGNTYFARYES